MQIHAYMLNSYTWGLVQAGPQQIKVPAYVPIEAEL